jgi:hypothetical protein
MASKSKLPESHPLLKPNVGKLIKYFAMIFKKLINHFVKLKEAMCDAAFPSFFYLARFFDFA